MASQIDKIQAELTALKNQQTAAYSDLLNKRNVEAEYKRQYDEKVSEGDRTNYLYIEQYLLTPATVARTNAEAAYNDISNLVTLKDAELTTASENPLFVEEEQSAFEEKLEQAKAATSRAVQGTTKYLIYGAIALVIVIAAVVIIRKKLKA